jgi:hypothetical protein
MNRNAEPSRVATARAPREVNMFPHHKQAGPPEQPRLGLADQSNPAYLPPGPWPRRGSAATEAQCRRLAGRGASGPRSHYPPARGRTLTP